MMDENKRALPLLIFRECIWWLLAAGVAAGALFPIWKAVEFRYLIMNAVVIFVAVLYFQYIVFFRQSVLLRPKWLRFLLFAFNLNFFIFVIRQSQFFISIYDTFLIEDLGKLKAPLTLTQIEKLFQYFYFETTLGVAACLLMIATLNGRIVISYWKTARLRLNAGDEE